jgi:nicotinamide mononucleotide transporter
MSRLNASFTLFGEHVLWTDLIGNILSLAVVMLAIRKTIWTWPVQLAGALLVGVPLAIKNGLYASGAVYGIFFVMVIVGFWKWLQESRTSVATADKAAVTV